MKQDSRLINKIILQFARTFIIINIAQACALLVDGLVVSRYYGPNAMAAVGVSSPFFAIMTLFCSVISIGTQVLCSNALGQGDREQNQKIYSNSLMVMILVIFLLTVFCLYRADIIAIAFGADRSKGQLFVIVQKYLTGIFVGIPGFMFFLFFSPFVTLDGNRHIITVATIMENVFNIVGDLAVAKMFPDNIAGIGFVTGISWNLAVFILLINFFRKESMFKFKLQKIDLKCLSKVIYIGSPRLSRYVSKIFSKVFMNRLVLFFGGTIAMSAMSVNQVLTGIVLVIGLGLGECVKVFTQMLYSERDAYNLKKMMSKIMRMLLTSTVVFAAVIIVFSKQISGIFVTSHPEAASLTVLALICLAASIPFNGICCVLIDYLQGAKMIGYANLATILHRFICPILSTLVFGYLYGVTGVFLAIPFTEIIVIMLYGLLVLFKGREGARSIERIMFLPEDFEADIASDLSMSVRNMEEVVRVSERVSDYLKENGDFSKRIINVTALCIEELAGNVVEHGFVLDSKEHNCDIRIIIDKENHITIRIRDDCPLFDIKKKYEEIQNSEFYENVGIKMMYQMTDKIDYVSMLHLNILYIQV